MKFATCEKTKVIITAILAFAVISTGAFALEKKTEMIIMPDGVGLATDIYIPDSKYKMSAILIRTPYNKDAVGSMFQPIFAGVKMVMVVQDVRGRYASEGISSIFIDDVSDGYETVEWLARQPWSNGKIGTAGISAMGITQYVMHKKEPEHLTCQNVMAAPGSLYDDIVYQGGGVRRALFYGWVLGQNFPTHIMQLILSQVDYSDVWHMMDLTPDYDKANVPIMHMAGWYDLYLPGNLNAFNGIREKGGPNARDRQYLVVGPWTHGGFIGLMGTQQGELKYPDNSIYSTSKLIKWFDECMNGADNGFFSGPRVRYYVMGDPEDETAPGNEWRTSEVWPIPSEATPFYFHKDGSLSTEKAGAEEITFIDDPANPVMTPGSRDHAQQRHPVDLRVIESRDDVMVFTTPVLEAPVEITGNIIGKIYFKTDVVDTDWVVRLSDVYPDGRSMLVTDGVARASHRESKYYRKFLVPGEVYEMDVDVWPTSLIFNKGHKIRIVVSATNFPRFDVNHHNGRFFNISPGELEKAKETGLEQYVYTPDIAPDSKIANTTLLMGADAPSHIILPVVKAAAE